MPGQTRVAENKGGPSQATTSPPSNVGSQGADSLKDKLADPLVSPQIKQAKQDEGLAAATRPLDATGDANKWKGGKVETQSSKHLFVLYEQAAKALVTLGTKTTDVAGATNGTPKLCPELKGRKRALEKIQADYDGHPERLVDIARASIFYDDAPSLEKGVAAVNGTMEVVREKDNFKNPLGGYRDYNFNVRIDGHICELQLHLTKILDAKAKGHHDYEEVRTIEALAKSGKPLSKEQLETLKTKKADMWKLYNDAYADAGGTVTEEHRSKEPKKPGQNP